eukprot:COSAG01_NODE_15451_length_1336_cov_2.333872_2_plen_179_part_00
MQRTTDQDRRTAHAVHRHQGLALLACVRARAHRCKPAVTSRYKPLQASRATTTTQHRAESQQRPSIYARVCAVRGGEGCDCAASLVACWTDSARVCVAAAGRPAHARMTSMCFRWVGRPAYPSNSTSSPPSDSCIVSDASVSCHVLKSYVPPPALPDPPAGPGPRPIPSIFIYGCGWR